MSLATLNITKKIGPDGQPITPVPKYDGGSVMCVPGDRFVCGAVADMRDRYPAPFVCDIKARNARAEALIRDVEDAPYGA
jgi:hypothetical protein